MFVMFCSACFMIWCVFVVFTGLFVMVPLIMSALSAFFKTYLPIVINFTDELFTNH